MFYFIFAPYIDRIQSPWIVQNKSTREGKVMNRLIGGVALALLCSTGASASAWVVGSDEGRADFYVKFNGEVPKRCEMRANKNLETLTFDLEKKSDTKTFAFKAWCNSYGSKGKLVIDGFQFKNGNGDVIPMTYKFNGDEVTNTADTVFTRIDQVIDISNDINKSMSDRHELTIKSSPQKGARHGAYNGAMYVSLFHM